jgi:HK97 family phage major capsid protein
VLLDARDRHEGTAFTLGDGSGKPKGLITAVAADAGSIVAPTTAEAFAVADIYKVAAALPARHQANASWMANHILEYAIRQMATGDGANHAFWADLGQGTPPTLLGKSWRGCSDMDATFSAAATAAHNYLLLFGDLKKYQIVDRVGATTETIPHVMGADGRPKLVRGLVLLWRAGADCLDTNAFRLLDIPTSA